MFAAYAQKAAEQQEKDTREEPQWLRNSSFQVGPLSLPKDASDSKKEDTSLQMLSETSLSDKEEPPKKHKKKRKKHKKDKHHRDNTEKQYEDFCIDTKKVVQYLSVNTISRPAVPKYHVKYHLSLGHRVYRKKHKDKRYFKLVLKKQSNQSDTELQVITKETLSKMPPLKNDENSSVKEEEEIMKKTAFYNKSLSEEPNNLNMWMEYVHFQDSLYNYEKHFKKGSMAKAQTVLAERKIAILDKALSYNPNCEVLLRERIKVASSAFSTDELQIEMEKMVKKNEGNIILWQGYIEASQCSMAQCNIANVTALYSKCLSTLHKLRRNTLLEKKFLEENILRMLYQCGLFLKQSGLFEQLWTLLRMYLELNLSPTVKNKFDVNVNFDEDQFQELEEVIFRSELPLHELWLRTEKLRECCHFLPVQIHQNCEDPQRIVFTDDVVELVHPITMPENTFKFVGTILTLLKIPLLPNRHSTTQSLGLDYVPWSLDSIETILAVFFPLYPTVDITNLNLLPDTLRFTVGPQYLRNIPGQEEYLALILSVFENASDCLNGKDQLALRVWWFRFQRLLIILESQNRFKMPQFLKKKIKTGVKNFLKRDENRNEQLYYLEYALMEKELANIQKCMQVLSTALSMNQTTLLVSKNWPDSQATRCLLYRTLVENTIADQTLKQCEKIDTVLKSLISLVLNREIDKVAQDLAAEADAKFQNICADLVADFSGKPALVGDHFLPDFFTDFHICYGWFLISYKGYLECELFLENSLKVLEDRDSSGHFQIEVLYEFYVATVFRHCMENLEVRFFRILDELVLRAIEKFPNNLFFLSVLAKEQTAVKIFGPHWWPIEKLLLKTERALPIIFAAVIYDAVWHELMENTMDTITGSKLEMSPSLKYKFLALYRKATKIGVCTRRCGLMWRLYLQFVYTFFDPEFCRKVYYSAVEECPWLKALYIDAAVYIPDELPQIQDLIIEKQLRLHVTPEELEILRI